MGVDMHQVGLIVPTLDAGEGWRSWLGAFESQREKPGYRLVIDSASSDATAALARDAGFEVRGIERREFDHGGTRTLGVEILRDAKVLVFLTQDAVLADPDSLRHLVECFRDPCVGLAYGRQIPHPGAGPIGAHARIFNYPGTSQIRTSRDRHRFGIKTAFISNSFAAYRRDALLSIGCFPRRTIMNEDAWVAGQLLLAGWKLAYRADAVVAHSHDYSAGQEFRRYFDIGVFHADEPWLARSFGDAGREGRRFVLSELGYLGKTVPWLLPAAALRTGLKYLGFHLGRSYRQIPRRLRRRLSMNRGYWDAAPPEREAAAGASMPDCARADLGSRGGKGP